MCPRAGPGSPVASRKASPKSKNLSGLYVVLLEYFEVILEIEKSCFLIATNLLKRTNRDIL